MIAARHAMRPLPPRRLLLALLLALGCAGKSVPLPPGDDLEAPESDGTRLGLTPQPRPPDEQALSDAFDPPEEREEGDAAEGDADSSGDEGSTSASTQAPSTPPAATAPTVSPEEQQARTALEEAKRLLKAQDAAGVEQALAGAADVAVPELIQTREELLVQAARLKKDPGAQARHAERWLLSCGPKRPDTCRARALRALAQANPKSERPANIREADACLQKVEAALRAPGQVPLPPCLGGAGALYRRMKDGLMEARVALAKGLATSREQGRVGQALSQLDAAERKCTLPRCMEVRRRALKHLARLNAQENRLHDAAKAALRDMELGQRGLPVEQQPYARTPDVEKRCAALDAKEGAGSCRKLERSLLGRYTFRDFSRERPREGLPAERVKEVNAHFAITLEECLATQATRLRPPASESYEVRWSILNDGRVDGVKMGRPDQVGTELDRCLREQFSLWRYPPYRGERQHVEQRFVVHARERR